MCDLNENEKTDGYNEKDKSGEAGKKTSKQENTERTEGNVKWTREILTKNQPTRELEKR